MKIAIYSRKSKMTETGDSIQNQINICKEYANRYFGEAYFLIYEDEGFSGGNTQRPMFKKLIEDANKKKFEVLICYRLDRVSRNVNDFSSTLKLLDHNNIAFVSVTEQFDTSNPLGKAMLSIASVFAELERDTIAQRIIDNFTELAKTGRYLTSTPPEGFKRKKVIDDNGKYYNVVEVVPSEIEKIKLIYEKYIEWQSNTKVEKYCLENNIKTKAGKTIKSDWITRILTHQLFAVADEHTYEYFKSIGTQVVAEKDCFDGKHGITVFRKTKHNKGKHNAVNDPEKIMIGVGAHDGIIDSLKWISVQKLIKSKASLGIRNTTGNYGLFSGLLRCLECGSYMRPCCVRNGKFHYVCVTKEKSRKSLCQMKNAPNSIDTEITEKIGKLLNCSDSIINNLEQKKINLKQNNKCISEKTDIIAKKIKDNEKSLTNLVMKLSKTESDILISKIEEQVEKLDFEIKELKKELDKLNSSKTSDNFNESNSIDIKNAVNKLRNSNFNLGYNTLAKRNILKTLIKQINWNGESLSVIFIE